MLLDWNIMCELMLVLVDYFPLFLTKRNIAVLKDCNIAFREQILEVSVMN